jgi:hypothetical protein
VNSIGPSPDFPSAPIPTTVAVEITDMLGEDVAIV